MDDNFAWVCGYAGNILFGFKSLAQIISCYRRKSCKGVSKLMLILDFGGNVGCAYFIHATTGFTLIPQFINYGFATLWLIILFIMMFIYDRHHKDSELKVKRLCGILPPKHINK